ncbi:polysaccharide biosynthesis/export family protein [Granulicella sibirica]|uniref:Capsule polysaccharide export protein n=1 Tax=Granulicella sibirica TaxID=2479048 RepID=A0A4Q0SXR3_9BACT|nr:SLBB domain-containing protein [Granulicella sibirica]RXH54199.1 hypothetical protein GRAN_4850 [Granulicella sibirica]
MHKLLPIAVLLFTAGTFTATGVAQNAAATLFSSQTPFAPGQQSLSATDQSANSTEDDSLSSTRNAVGASPISVPMSAPMSVPTISNNTSFSSSDLIDILQGNPDLLTQVKEQAAGFLSQRGMTVSANDFTDQQFFEQIQTSEQLRSSLTDFLLARGYSLDSNRAPVEGSQTPGSLSSQPCINSSTFLMPPSAINTVGAEQALASNCAYVMPRDMARDTTPKEDRPRNSPDVLNRPAPYNLRSLHDLYKQLPESATPLRRFGSNVFTGRNALGTSRTLAGSEPPLDVPLGPDYVLGPGDNLSINVWGATSQTVSRTIDREGAIPLPENGRMQVAGMTLGQASAAIEGVLKPQYRDAHISITVSRLHSVRVYVAGDVQRPGGYDIGALATPISALIAAGGPTATGSLRVVRHMRGGRLIESIDLYDFLLHGVHSASVHFESGDTLLIPPAGSQVSISGAVRRPAIYELLPGTTSLAGILEDAGGATATAALDHITIERIADNHERQTITLGSPDGKIQQTLETFAVRDGDAIRVSPILPYSQKVIYLQGHVVRPGRVPFSDAMKLSDVLRSNRDMLPEPAAHGEIIRLVPPDLHAETIDFNVPDVMIGNSNLALEPFDTIRILGRYEADSPTVSIQGEVLRPGTYPLSIGMTAAGLVRMAGGFKRDAMQSTADLTSYTVEGEDRISENLVSVKIGAAVAGTDRNADVALKAGDALSVHQITGWGDIGQSVTIDGQVRFPGSYGFRDGDHLSTVLRRAGGFRESAYSEGAILARDQVKELEEKSRDELVRQIETTSAAARLSPALSAGGSGDSLQLIKAQQDEVLNQLKNHPPTGRLVIHITADIDSWANTPADIELRRGDVLTIPKRPGFVLISGQVYNPTALTFTPDKTAAWYLARAGGANTSANQKEIFIIRANGLVIGRRSGSFFGSNVLSTKLDPGDVVVVPQKILGNSLLWRNLLATAQLASSIAITAAVAAL